MPIERPLLVTDLLVEGILPVGSQFGERTQTPEPLPEERNRRIKEKIEDFRLFFFRQLGEGAEASENREEIDHLDKKGELLVDVRGFLREESVDETDRFSSLLRRETEAPRRDAMLDRLEFVD